MLKIKCIYLTTTMNSHLGLVLLFVTTLVTLNQSTNTPETSSSNSKHLNLNSIEDDSDNLIVHKSLKQNIKKLTHDDEIIVPITQTTNKTSIDSKKDTNGRKIPLALDPRYNKMLPSHTNLLKDNDNDSHDEDDSDEDYLDDYYDDISYDDDSTENKTETNKKLVVEKPKKVYVPLSPIKKDEKSILKKSNEKVAVKDDDDDDYDADGDDEYDDDDITDEGDIVFNQNVPCPRDCICAKNYHSFLVATCSRLDADVQIFGTDITDLVVVDVGPKYPIMLGPEFFVKVGLKHVNSIKISNCTIELLHPTAFHGLDNLFTVNLTNVGLASIHPNLFEQNKRLRLLTISGNDLSVMTRRGSSELQYLIKSDSIEELDLSNNNLNDLLSTSFNQLTNIVYINLANNNIKNLPESIFDSVETIEELDLSVNSIITLPSNIFNRTALSILRLHHNDIVSDLNFVTSDLQKLDLSFCSIEYINNHMFNKMTSLTNLMLKGNGLKRIQPDSFISLKNLRHIDLSTNDLDQISSLLFFKNNDLSVIKLYDNPKLSELPTDGFQSITGKFSTYLLDISNCAIGALGPATFSQMPDINILKLSWNNINNLDKSTFKYLENLTELDLSNNLIVKLYNQTFLHNRQLTKLNLAGNPIQELSSNLFYPLTTLKELDISDCELQTIFNDNNYVEELGFKFYHTLKSLNISFNKIKNINKYDIQNFKNLRTFDISDNPLKCTDDFINLIKYLINKNILSGKVYDKMDLELKEYKQIENLNDSWNKLEMNICKRSTNNNNKKIITNKPNKVINYSKLFNDDSNESNSDDADDEYDDDYDEDDDNKKNINEKKEIINKKKNEKPIKDNGLFVQDINIMKETSDKFLRDKLMPETTDDSYDDDDDDDDDEEIIVGTTKIYYSSNYKFIPILVVLLFVIILIIIIAKIISILMVKRGERYRMAILASKNSIIYQKLSEDIASTEKLSKNPKVHRYARINEV